MTSSPAEQPVGRSSRQRDERATMRSLSLAHQRRADLPATPDGIVPSPLLQSLPRPLANTFHRVIGQRQVDGADPLPGRIGVVSSTHGNGVSTATRALAIVLASDLNANVCLVDVSRGASAKSASAPPPDEQSENAVATPAAVPGIVDLLAGNVTIESALRTTADPRVSFIDAGSASHSELSAAVRSNQFLSLLDELDRAFDYVIIDAPPVLLSPDGVSAMRHVEAYYFVVRHGKTQIDELRSATAELEPLPCLGVIINRYSTRVPKLFQRVFTP
jgi:Mrp family chromosome partitioning ATPase